MTEPQETVKKAQSTLSITALVKYTIRAWLMSLRSEEIVVVKFVTSGGGTLTFAEFLKGRKL